jgi:hypothetical protein
MTTRLGDFLAQHWQRQAFAIAMDHDDADVPPTVLVDGIVMSDQPDLGLHVGVTHFIDVTHIPTGKRIGGFVTLGGAMEFTHRIAYLRDWHHKDTPLTAAELTAIELIKANVLASEHRPRKHEHD